ncbi:MAG TPA: hypothetical protein VF463_02185 [Sphingobium sp.]
MTDARNIDLTGGQLMFDVTPFTIGDAKGGLAHTLFFPGLYGFRHDEMITAVADDCDLTTCYVNHITIAQGKRAASLHGMEQCMCRIRAMVRTKATQLQNGPTLIVMV